MDGAAREAVEVEVWCPFTERWVRGFVVIRGEREGVVLQRTGDDGALPGLVPPERVRPL
jgi:hypothetical protein